MVRKLKAKDLKLPIGKFTPSVRKKFRDIEIPDAVKIILEQAVYALAGLVLSLRTFDGACMPFGIAFAAAAPLRTCLAAALGASAGYLVAGTGTQALQYIAAIAVVTVMSRALDKVFHRLSARSGAVIAAGTGCAVTGAARVAIDGVTPAGVALALAEVALAAGCAYLFERVTELNVKKIKTADRTAMASPAAIPVTAPPDTPAVRAAIRISSTPAIRAGAIPEKENPARDIRIRQVKMTRQAMAVRSAVLIFLTLSSVTRSNR